MQEVITDGIERDHQAAKSLNEEEPLSIKFQRVGAALQGKLTEFDAQRAAAERLRREDEERRRIQLANLSKERQVAMAKDAQTAIKYLEAGEAPAALSLLNNRVALIEQYGGNPSDTIELGDMIDSGDVEGALRELHIFNTAAVTHGLVKPLMTVSERQAEDRLNLDRERFEFDETYKKEQQRLDSLRASLDQRQTDLAQQRFDWEKERGEKGTIPPGYEEVDGKLRPMEGGPADDESAKATKKLHLAQADYARKFGIVDDTITNAIKFIEQEGRWAAGSGSVLTKVPESSARDLAAMLQTINANLGFEELQTMREASPTGGALGQVTERELAFMQAVQGSLDQGQSPDRLLNTLKDVQARRREFDAERQQILSGGMEPAPTPKTNVNGYAIKAID